MYQVPVADMSSQPVGRNPEHNFSFLLGVFLRFRIIAAFDSPELICKPLYVLWCRAVVVVNLFHEISCFQMMDSSM